MGGGTIFLVLANLSFVFAGIYNTVYQVPLIKVCYRAIVHTVVILCVFFTLWYFGKINDW